MEEGFEEDPTPRAMARPFSRTAVDGSSTSWALLVTDEVVVWVWSALGTV